MSVFSWIALAVALGVFAGQTGYDLLSGFVAAHRDKKRRDVLLAGIRARVASARTTANEQRRSPITEEGQGNHRDGAAGSHEGRPT